MPDRRGGDTRALPIWAWVVSMMHASRVETMNRSEHSHMNSGRNVNEIKDFGFMLRPEFMRRFMRGADLSSVRRIRDAECPIGAVQTPAPYRFGRG